MRILAFPRDENPYQELLYRPMRKAGARVVYLEGMSSSHTLNLLMMPFRLIAKRLQGFDVLHVHWTYLFYLPFGSGRTARGFLEFWAAVIWLLTKLLGMKLVWTAHNVRPHEPVFLNDRRAHRFLGNLADHVIVHSPAAEAQLREIGVRNTRLKVIPHGNYIGAYPDGATRMASRKHLNIAADAHVFLFFGLIRAYKGIEQLLAAFASLKDPNAVLIIAGEVQQEDLRAIIESASKKDNRLLLRLERVADDQLQYLFCAADFTVLPYEKSTTSGVALLAASFACPLIVPDQAAFADIPDAARISFAPGGLADALRYGAFVSTVDQEAKSAAARQYAESLSWDNVAADTIAFLESTS